MEVLHKGITDNEKVIYKTLHILIQIYKYIENCVFFKIQNTTLDER